MSLNNDDTIKGELQTEARFRIVTSIKQEREENDINTTSHQQHVKAEMETDEQSKVFHIVSIKQGPEENDINNTSHQLNIKTEMETDEQSKVFEVCFPCPHCPYDAATSDGLKAHILTHSREKNFKCDICDKTFSRNQSLKQHIITVHDMVRAFSCPHLHCSYKTAYSGHFKKHILTHTQEKNFMSDILTHTGEKNFNTTSHQQNVKTEMDTDEQSKVFEVCYPWPCPHCSYYAATSDGLKSHILTHSRLEKNFKCDICEKKVTTRYRLKQHIRTVHDKIKQLFPCPFPHCAYKASQGVMKRHILTHTEVKCTICDKKFTQSSDLIRHISQVHAKFRAFPIIGKTLNLACSSLICPHCPYEAVHSRTLELHMSQCKARALAWYAREYGEL